MDLTLNMSLYLLYLYIVCYGFNTEHESVFVVFIYRVVMLL